MDRQTDTASGELESDDTLRRVYGDQAVFTRAGSFTLVHLDTPNSDTIAQRLAQFDPADFFFDDCPLCVHAREEGGHVVFDGDEATDPLRAGAPGVAFDRALDDLAAAAQVFAGEIEGAVSPEVADRYRADVGQLHERFIETLWREESTRRVEAFEQQFERARATVAAIGCDADRLRPGVERVERALDTVAAIWRAL